MSQSQKMRAALHQYVISGLLERGFQGTYPDFRKVYDERIELIVFQSNKWGNSFTVEISTVYPNRDKRHSNVAGYVYEHPDFSWDWITVGDTNERYRLKGRFDGWFYYTDVYRHGTRSPFARVEDRWFWYEAVGEKRAATFKPTRGMVLVQKADDKIYERVCKDVNRQMKAAYKWWKRMSRHGI